MELTQKQLKIISNPIRMKIMQLLFKKPLYAAQIASVLDMSEQKLHYHIKLLVSNNLIKVIEKKEIRGTIAKKYLPTIDTINYQFNIKGKSLNKPHLLNDFIIGNKLNSYIIVGSPDPHGPYKSRCRDGHFAINLALFLGKFCSSVDDKVKLDVQVTTEIKNENLIIIGGPKINLVADEINQYLPAKFTSQGLIGKSKYNDESIGLIAKIDNPFTDNKFQNEQKSILYLAGISSIGTKAAIIAATKYFSMLEKNYNKPPWYTIVEGFDLDGDGEIDSIEILESSD